VLQELNSEIEDLGDANDTFDKVTAELELMASEGLVTGDNDTNDENNNNLKETESAAGRRLKSSTDTFNIASMLYGSADLALWRQFVEEPSS